MAPGKTTLLNGICGIEPLDSGSISMDASVRWSYLQQAPSFEPEEDIMDHLYASDMAAVVAMRAYASALESGQDDSQMQAAYEQMDLHDGWDFEARAKKSLGNSICMI